MVGEPERVEPVLVAAALPVPEVLAETRSQLARRCAVPGVRVADVVTLEGAFDQRVPDVRCPRVVIVGDNSRAREFMRRARLESRDVFRPIAVAGVYGLRGGLAVNVGTEFHAAEERMAAMLSMLHVQGFTFTTSPDAARAYVERVRLELEGGQLGLEVDR